jgi:hypothetical protein
MPFLSKKKTNPCLLCKKKLIHALLQIVDFLIKGKYLSIGCTHPNYYKHKIRKKKYESMQQLQQTSALTNNNETRGNRRSPTMIPLEREQRIDTNAAANHRARSSVSPH